MRFALVVSFVLNLLLATSIVVARVDASRTLSRLADVAVKTQPPSQRPAWNAFETAETIEQYYEWLRARGLTSEESRLPLGGWLQRTLAESRAPHSDYWRSSDVLVRQVHQQRWDAESRLRAALLSIYGDAAVEFPEFAMLYSPLGPAFGFLGSPQQIQLARLEAEWRLAARPLDLYSLGVGADACTAAAFDLPRFFGLPRESLLQIEPPLSEQQLFEYSLRTSPAAVRLRALELSEDSFRSAFQVLRELDTAPSAPKYLSLRNRLKAFVGERAFDALWAKTDPLYATLIEVVADANVAPHIVAAAYGVINRSQENLLEFITNEGASAGSHRGAFDLQQAEQRGLEELLGVELAAEFAAVRFQPWAKAGSRSSPCSSG